MNNPKTYKTNVLTLAMLAMSATALGQTVADSTQVNVAFGSKAKSELMGGVSAIDMVDLNRKNYNTYSLDALQAYAGGYTGQLWNMGDALVLVDGVPRDANNVLPTEIEQITFLKSASAVALYGSRAAKGAVLITTKRGRTDGLKVSVRGNAGLFTPKEYPTYLGAAQYMSLYNEALANDGKSPVYTDEDIYNYASGRNPYRYPSIDFFSKDYLKKAYTRYDGNAEFEGGGKFAHFYANIGLYHVGDLTGWVDANATFYDQRGDRSNYWAQSATLRPTTQYPLTPLVPIDLMNPDVQDMQKMIANSNYVIGGKYMLGGTQSLQTNPFAAMYAAGYSTYTSRQLQFDAGVNFNLDKVLRGLSFKTHAAIDYATSYSSSIQNDYSTYEPVWTNMNGKDEIIGLNKYGTDKRSGTKIVSGSKTVQTVFFSGQFDYNRQFGLHALDATLLA